MRPPAAERGFHLRGLGVLLASLCCIAATSAATAAATGSRAAAAAGAAEHAPQHASGISLPQALAAFADARAWLDADELPGLDAPRARVVVEGAEAAAAVLRLDGRVVGTGVGTAMDPAERPLLVRRAVGRAVSEALGDDIVRAVRSELSDKVTRRFTLELEFAGKTRPLLGRTIAEAATRIVPGRDGIAVLRGADASRAFPSIMLADDTAAQPELAIASLLRAAGLPVKELGEYGSDLRVSLGQFSTLRLRQGSLDEAPMTVERGGRTVAIEEADATAARVLSITLCARLSGMVLPKDPSAPDGPGLLLGPYNPGADRHQPPIASVRETGLAALALALSAESTAIPGPLAQKARASALSLLEGIAGHPDLDGTPVAAALALFAADALCRADDAPASAARADAARERARSDAARLAAMAEAIDGPARRDLAASAALEAAIASTTEPGPQPATGRSIARLLAVAADDREGGADRAGKAEDGAPEGASVAIDPASARAALTDALLPLALVRRSGRLDPSTSGALERFLGETAEAVRRAQLVADDALDVPADLEGGLPLGGGRGARADTRCLLIAAALASSGPHGDTGPASAAEARLAEQRFLRFLMQHVADSPWCEGFRRPDALRGMVRASLATDDCPPGATAAGLLLAVSLGSR